MTRADRSRVPEVGPDPVFSFPTIAHHRLPNGLRVRTIEHPGIPVVSFVLQVEGGSSADLTGREGLAALTADMVDEGTGALSAIEVSDALERLGAAYDVDVAPDATVFSLTTLERFARPGATLLARLVTTPSLRDDDFQRVRQLRCDRLRQLKDLPPAVAERAFLRAMYGEHPYGHLSIGDLRALEGLSLGDVEAFHRATYRPDRALLVVGGAMSHDDLAACAAEAFGGWSVAAAPSSEAPAAASRSSTARLIVVPRPGAAQSELRIGHLSARRDTPHYPALIVMNAVLGGQFVSRVNLKLREEKGYTYGARTAFDWRRGLSPFALHASVHTAATVDAIRDSLHELTAIRRERPPSDGELALAKASLTKGYPRNFETVQQVTRSVAQLALFGLADSYFADFGGRIHAVTQDDVVAAASQYIDPERLTTVVVGDYAAIGEGLGELGRGEPDVHSPTV